MRSTSSQLADCLTGEELLNTLYKAVIMCVGGNRRESLVLELGVVGLVYLPALERLMVIWVGSVILKGFSFGFLGRLINFKKWERIGPPPPCPTHHSTVSSPPQRLPPSISPTTPCPAQIVASVQLAAQQHY